MDKVISRLIEIKKAIISDLFNAVKGLGVTPTSLGQKTKAQSMSVTVASDQDTITVSSTQLPTTLGQKTKAQSLPVVFPSDSDKLPVQTDERPSNKVVAITPSDTVSFTDGACRGIYVGVSGDINIVVNGTASVFKNANAGSIIPVQATRVNATNTIATNLLALY